jgi:hypothetical protein
MNQATVSVVFPGAGGGLQQEDEEVAVGAEEGHSSGFSASPAWSRSASRRPTTCAWPTRRPGTPSPYGNLAPHPRSYLDALDIPGCGDLRTIVWSDFASEDGLLHRGREATLPALFGGLFHLGGVFCVLRLVH